MEKQPELIPKDTALVLVIPVDFVGEVKVKTSDGKILYTSTLPVTKALDEDQTDDSSNPQGPPPPPPGH